MSVRDLDIYYANQAGSGIVYFQGIKNQRGSGFFSKFIKPGLAYLGKKLLGASINIGQDFLDGNDLKKSAKSRMKSTLTDVANDSLNRGRQFLQTGSGLLHQRRRKRKRRNNKTAMKKSLKKKTYKKKVHKRKTQKKKPRRVLGGRNTKKRRTRRTRRKKKRSDEFNFLK